MEDGGHISFFWYCTKISFQLQSSKEKLESRRLEQLSDSEDKQMLINENRKLAKDLDAVCGDACYLR